ncbi:hypothetical protein SDC9_137232 [bioreactor metagenome]|uniref:Uncharacterized protein n=1 Tax=bioreactor metagenome TaxID=1076179 RepID=A0A645DLH5_9ZZZZ
MILRVLPEPVHERKLHAVEIGGVVGGHVGLRCCNAPFKAAFVWLQLFHEDLKQRCARQLVLAHERNLVARLHDKAYVVQHLAPGDCLGDAADGEDVVAHFAVGFEVDKRVAARGGREVVHLEVIEHLLAARRLFGLGGVRAEA